MHVYREPLSPLVQIEVTPSWPDFVILRADGSWYAVTNAGRPKQPYFWLSIGSSPDLPDDFLLTIAREALDNAYATAHPNGCPKVGH